jgi:type I site-specific restriction endonuclease
LDDIGFGNYEATSVQKQARHPISDGIGLIVIDECHHAIRDSQYQKLFDAGVPVIGATATPFRLDGRGLGDMFGKLVIAATARELIEGGYIQEPVIYSHPAPDMTGAKKIGGDWSMKETGRRSNRPKLLADIVDTWNKRNKGMRTLAFASTIEHSKSIVSSFCESGVRAEHLDGKTPKNDRDAILGRLRSGKTKVVSNVGIATEGFDMPTLDCGIMARPTASLCLWLQMCGRVMRKEGNAFINDHAGNVLRHGSPTRAIEYTLDCKSKQKPDPLGLKMCTGCLLMVRVGTMICPDCGKDLSPVATALAKSNEGELILFQDKEAVWEQVGHDRIKYKAIIGESPLVIKGKLIQACDNNKRMIFEHYVKIAWKKGYKMQWASVQYKRIFKHWPGSALLSVVTDLMNREYKK